MLRPLADGGAIQRGGSLVIDAIVQGVVRELVGNSGKMDDGVALLQQGAPVQRSGKIRKHGRVNWVIKRNAALDAAITL